ncbi:MAG: hypothetical protein UIH27_01975 [Ruminococcus sp.]|nr:hypothetical protein [Ruminococcus sp.]
MIKYSTKAASFQANPTSIQATVIKRAFPTDIGLWERPAIIYGIRIPCASSS